MIQRDSGVEIVCAFASRRVLCCCFGVYDPKPAAEHCTRRTSDLEFLSTCFSGCSVLLVSVGVLLVVLLAGRPVMTA